MQEEACIKSGGSITTKSCCKSIIEFPDTCLIGACGCAPQYSHEVVACECGEGRCWDSSKHTCINSTVPSPSNATATEAVTSVVNANNQFAIELYSQYKSQDGNIFFSPYSISTALAMTYEGARGATAEEMQSVLHFPIDNDSRRNGFLQIYNEINKKDKNYTLSTANALWAQEDYKFLDSYFTLIRTYYGGNVTNLDFVGDTENSRITINRWVEEHTNNKIKDILQPGTIDPVTRLVLTNAVYFKARWFIPFLNETSDQDFRVTPTNIVKVKMMSLYGYDVRTSSGKSVPLSFNYAETNEAQIIELPYEGNETSMLILLPKGDTLQTLEQSLSIDKLNQWKAMLNETGLDGVYLPRFKFETKYSIPETLEDMGMKTAFTSSADFSGMDGTKSLYISQVIHQAFIDVNETGTEAAAATAVVMTLGMSSPKPQFRADHPFIFIIQQRDTGNILFMGRVTDPTAS
jgi:serpin B